MYVGVGGGGALKLTTASDHSGQSVDNLYSPQKFQPLHTNTRTHTRIHTHSDIDDSRPKHNHHM